MVEGGGWGPAASADDNLSSFVRCQAELGFRGYDDRLLRAWGRARAWVRGQVEVGSEPTYREFARRESRRKVKGALRPAVFDWLVRDLQRELGIVAKCRECAYGPACTLKVPLDPATCYGPARRCPWCGHFVGPGGGQPDPGENPDWWLCGACFTFVRAAGHAREVVEA